jgi:thiamine-monophosphate kinase
MVDVTAIGSVRPRRVLRRDGARPGDGVYVTGTVGDAAVGLRVLQDCSEASVPAERRDAFAAEIERYLRPDPRVRLGVLLGRNRAASACMDLSDGLADAVRQVAAASGVGITIDEDALPVAAAVRRWHQAQGSDVTAAVLQGGDDYELLFTARASYAGRLRAVASAGGVSVTRIGEVTRDRSLTVRTGTGETPLPEGFEHFR